MCQFDNPTVPAVPATRGTWSTNSAPVDADDARSRVAVLRGQPAARLLEHRQPHRRLLDRPGRPSRPATAVEGNLASRAPWDVAVGSGSPMFTTVGNNAKTAEAWTQPARRPAAPASCRRPRTASTSSRWSNQWNDIQVRPDALARAGHGNDISACGHQPLRRPQPLPRLLVLPRLHRGRTSTLQTDNFGNVGRAVPAARRPRDRRRPGRCGHRRHPDLRGPRQRQPDHAQRRHPAASRTSTCSSRSRARFYSPCVDGDFDTSVFGHEYTHPISNRMVGGPDSDLTGAQAGAMGESWSDLDALEYLHEYGFVPTGRRERRGPIGPVRDREQEGRHPQLRAQRQPAQLQRHRLRHHRARGPRRRRDLERGQLRRPPGARRQVQRAPSRSTNTALQKRVRRRASPPRRRTCPGNRRWIQLMSTTPSCSSSRRHEHARRPRRDASPPTSCASVAPTRPRSGTRSPSAAWAQSAPAPTATDDDQPTPSFASPHADERDGHASRRVDEPTAGRDQREDLRRPVRGSRDAGGRHRSRTRHARHATVKFVPGTYHFVAQAPRLRAAPASPCTSTRGPDRQHVTVQLPPNWASTTKGATVAAAPARTSTDADRRHRGDQRGT